jgi:adenylate kinase family enzyme
MNKQFFILIGRSGCGKGTQAEMLKKDLETKGVENVVHITTGGSFREFITRDTYVSSLTRDLVKTGGLPSEFLAVWNWTNIFINTLKGGETVLLDGAPRRPLEVEQLHGAITFLGYENPIVIYVNVSEKWATERLLARGRDDDKNQEDIARRMGWFEKDVLPTIDVYLHDPRYKVLHINGEQTVEEVHKEIIDKLG